MAKRNPQHRPLLYPYVIFVFLFCLRLGTVAQAQVLLEAPQPEDTSIFLDTALFRQQFDLKEVPKHPHFVRKAALITAGAAAWVATFSVIDEPLQQFTQSHRTKVANIMAEGLQPLGRQRNLAPIAGAALLGGVIMKDQKLQKVGALSLGSIVVNALATDALKSSFGRHRPSITTENHIFDEPFSHSRNTSLPSSHTSTAFAVATTVATVYRDHKLVPPIAYGVATLVGVSRINDNMHWTTDVLAGAAVGYVSAKLVNRLYDVASQKLRARRQKLYFTPQIGTSSATLSMTLDF